MVYALQALCHMYCGGVMERGASIGMCEPITARTVRQKQPHVPSQKSRFSLC